MAPQNKTVLIGTHAQKVELLTDGSRNFAVSLMKDAVEGVEDRVELTTMVFGFRQMALHMLATELYNGIAQLGWDTKSFIEVLGKDLVAELAFIAEEKTGTIVYTPVGETEQ